MGIKILSEQRIPRPPTDICAMQDRLYVATKGKRVFFTADNLEGVKSILFSSQVNTLSSSGTVLYCGCEDGMLYGLSQVHKTVFRAAIDPAGVTCVLYDRTRGDIFAAAYNRKVVQLGENSIVKNTFYGYDSPVVSIDVSTNGTLSSASQNNQNIKLANTNTKDPKHIRLPSGFSEALRFISNEYIIVGTLDGRLYVYKTRGLELVETACASAGICSMHLHPDGLFILGLVNGTVALYRLSGTHLESIGAVEVSGIPVAFARCRSGVAVAVSREQRMGRWSKMKDGRNRIVLLQVE